MAKHLSKSRRRSCGGEHLFFAVMAAVTVFAWLLPLRPAVSEQEKRTLEPFPAFSLASLADGSYFEHIGLWFSDTFPARDRWIGVSQKLERLYGRSDIMVYGVADPGDAIPVVSHGAAEPSQISDVSPASPAPEAETNESAAAPAPAPGIDSPESEWNGKVIDNEELVTLGAVIQVGDSAYVYPTFSQFTLDRYIDNISRAAELLDGRCRVFQILALHSTSILLPRDFRDSIGCSPEEDMLDYLREKLDSRVYFVDTYGPLLRHNGEYIYFRSDHHWTALGAWYTYEEWAKTAGFAPVGLEKYREEIQEPFRGTLYYKANQSDKILPDSVHTYTPPGDVHLYVQFNKDSWERLGTEQPLITEIRGNDKYAAFLSGDVPMATFVNNDITDGSTCLLIKNSNGNPLSYYFTQHYQYTFVLDYRKYFARSLSQFVDYYHVDDVIFCLSSGQAQSDAGNGLLQQMIK